MNKTSLFPLMLSGQTSRLLNTHRVSHPWTRSSSLLFSSSSSSLLSSSSSSSLLVFLLYDLSSPTWFSKDFPQSILLWHYIQWKSVLFLCNLLLYVFFLKVKLKIFQWCWTVYQLKPEMTLNLLTLLIIVWNMGDIYIYIFGPNN